MMTDEQYAEKFTAFLLTLSPYQVEFALDSMIAAHAEAIRYFEPHTTEDAVQMKCERVAALVRARYEQATAANPGATQQIH